MDSIYFVPIIGFIGVLIGYFISLMKNKIDRSDKYFFAALDQKIKSHQEAYNLIWDLPSAAHKCAGYEQIFESCEKWYRQNCLYLEPEARKAFYTAYRTAWIYESQLNEWKNTKNTEKLDVEWNKIVNASMVIEKNVTVPLFRPKSLKEVKYNSKGVINE